MDQSLNLLIGFGAGTVASILAWWLVLNYFTPRLQVSDLNPLPQPLDRYPCGYRYRVKVRNVSRRHSVANLQLHARLVVKGLDQERPTVRSSMLLPVGANAFPVLESRRGRQSADDNERVYTFQIDDLETDAEPDLSPEVLARLEDRTIRIEELLELGSDAFIRFAVSATHGRSGYSRTFHRNFRLSDLCDGEFEDDSIHVKSSPQQNDQAEVGQP